MEARRPKQEIERKYKVRRNRLPPLENPTQIIQGYLSRRPAVRIRISRKGDIETALITIKGKGSIVRPEYEYEIPVEDARELLKMCPHPPILKARYDVVWDGKPWVIDEFTEARYKQLQVTEIELESLGERYTVAPWAGEDISNDPRYSNAALWEAERAP